MLILKNISKSYKPKKGKVVHALKDVSLSFPETGMVFLLGKSGSGKSTLMNIIGGLDSTDVGEITFLGKQVSSFNQGEYDAYRNTQIGFVFQEFNLIESFSVYQNIALSMRLQNQKVSKDEVIQLLETLDLKDEIDRMPYELSGGQKQRISIGRALIKNPKILLADEPTGALDSDTSKQIFDLLKSLSKSRLVIIVSHDRDFALAYGDRVIELSDGKVISDSNPEDHMSSDQTFVLKPPHLPLLDAFKIGFSAFLKKPVRMVLTLTLLIFAFTLFGCIHSITNYSIEGVTMNHAYAYDEKTVIIGRTPINRSYGDKVPLNLNQEHFEQLQETYPNRFMRPVYQTQQLLSTLNRTSHSSQYYPAFIRGYVHIDQVLLDKTGYTLLGRLPQREDEVVIPLHIVESYQSSGYRTNEVIDIVEPSDMIGRYLFDDSDVVIVGILDTKFNEERYRSLNDTEDYTAFWLLNEELTAINFNSAHTYLYVHESVIHNLTLEDNLIKVDTGFLGYYEGSKGDISAFNQTKSVFSHPNLIEKITSLPADVTLKQGFNATELSANQIILGNEIFSEAYLLQMSIDYPDLVNNEFHQVVIDYAANNYLTNKENLETMDSIYSEAEFIEAIEASIFIKALQYPIHFDLQTKAKINIAIEKTLLQDKPQMMRLAMNYDLRGMMYEYFDIEVVGFCEGDKTLVGASFFDEIQTEMGIYPFSSVLVKLSGDKHSDIQFLKDIQTLDTRFQVLNEIEYMMTYNNNAIVFFQNRILWVGIVLAMFSGMLFYNFINISIRNKKKDIGILRALGGRRQDIFRIFLTEALFMALIIFTISFIITMVGIHYFNIFVTDYIHLDVKIFWVEIKQAITLLLLTTSVATLSSWLPIYRYSRQKPVDVIKVIES